MSDVVLVPREQGFGKLVARRAASHWEAIASPGRYILRGVLPSRKLGEGFVEVSSNQDRIVEKWDAELPGPFHLELLADHGVKGEDWQRAKAAVERMLDDAFVPAFCAQMHHDKSALVVSGLAQGRHRIAVTFPGAERKVVDVSLPGAPIAVDGGLKCDIALELVERLDAFDSLSSSGVVMAWRVFPDGKWEQRTMPDLDWNGMPIRFLPCHTDIEVCVHGALDQATRWSAHGWMRTPGVRAAGLTLSGSLSAILNGVVQCTSAQERPSVAVLDYGDRVRLGEKAQIDDSGRFRLWERVGEVPATLRLVSASRQIVAQRPVDPAEDRIILEVGPR